MTATPTSVTFIGVAVSPRDEKARGRDAIDEQRGHAESVSREHACGLMRRVGLEGAMLEGDGDDEIGDEKKNHHEGSAERQRQQAARFCAASAPRSSPRATRADISLSSTEPVAMMMTPPGN